MWESHQMPSKSRLQAPHNHVDLILLWWPINDLGNLLPPMGNEWCDCLIEPLSQGLQFHLWESMTVFNAKCRRNSWAKSSHVRRRGTSKEANQRWAAPLKDMGNIIIIWALSTPWALITLLYSLKWIRGHPILVCRSISGILNLVDILATGSPSKSSHTILPSDSLNCLILYLSLSKHAWASFEVGTATMAGGVATLVWLCKVNGVGCGIVWPSGGCGGMWVSYGAIWLVGKCG